MKRFFRETVILTSILLFFTGLLFAQIKVACVGNSITQGWHGNPSYVPPLQKLLGSNYIVLNEGRSGTTVLKKGDVPYWTQNVFSQTLASNADVITIMLGTNDTKSKNWDNYGSEFKSDYVALIDTLRSANKNAQIFLVIPPPVCIDNYGIRNSVLKSVISIIKEVANEKGLTIIDVNTPLLSSCNCFADGVHPNAAGADTLANVFSRSITSIVKGRPEAVVCRWVLVI
jgi:lysophospholipase L1-like esterase